MVVVGGGGSGDGGLEGEISDRLWLESSLDQAEQNVQTGFLLVFIC